MRLAIDIGGSHIKAGLVVDSQVQQAITIETPQTLAAFETRLAVIIEDYQRRADFSQLGFALPGTVVAQQQVIHGGALPFLDQFSFLPLARRYHLQVRVSNDAKAAALAELRRGALQNTKSSAMLVLGTGLGLGICQNNEVMMGSHGQAGEISFMMTDSQVQSPKAFAGVKLSAVQLVADLAEVLHLPANGRDVFEHLDESPVAQSRYEAYCLALAQLIFNLQTVLDLETIAIGGGISQVPDLINMIQAAYANVHQIYPVVAHTIAPLKIVRARFASQANLIGAVEAFS